MTLNGITLRVEIAFAAGPYTLSPTWTDVTQFVKHVSTKRGRNNEFDQIEAGACTVTFDNADGRFTPTRTASPSPYQGNILPRKQIRVRIVGSGDVSKPIFKGYTERWSLTHPGGGGYSEAVCECADAFKILSTAKVMDFYGENVKSLNPAAYYPLSEAAGTVLFGDHSGYGRPAGVLYKRTANDQTSAGGAALTPPSTSVSFDPDGTSAGADIDLTAAMPAFPFKTDDWSMSMWFQLGSDYYPGGRSNPPLPGPNPSPPTPTPPAPPIGPGDGIGGGGLSPIVTPVSGDPGTGTVTWDTSGSGTGGTGGIGTGGSGIDGWRITPDNGGLPFDITPGQIAASGFPTIPLDPGACNSVTVQSHNTAGWGGKSEPSPCLTNVGVQDVYDNFMRPDSAPGDGLGVATNGSAWTDQAVLGLEVYQNAARAVNGSIGGNMLDVGTRDQDFVAWIKGNSVTGDADDYIIQLRGTDQWNSYFLDCPAAGAGRRPTLNGPGRPIAATSSGYPLTSYCGWHVQASEASGSSEFLVARDGNILFSVEDIVTGATGQKIGVRLQGSDMRCNLVDQGNPDKPRFVRAYPLVGGLSFTCRPPRENPHPAKYRVKVGGQTVESTTLPIVVTGLTDSSDYTWTMSAQKPDSGREFLSGGDPGSTGWGPESDIGHATPGWAAAPFNVSATATDWDVVDLSFTLGAANSVDYGTTPLRIVSTQNSYQHWEINPPYSSPLTITGVNPGFRTYTRFKVYVSGVWDSQRGCETVSPWSNEVYV